MRDQLSAPAINVATFPYRRKWTQAELDGVYDRFEKIRDVLTDAVGPTGQTVYIDPGIVAILALHASLAGTDVHEDQAFIESRVRPDASGMFANTIEWRVKGEFGPDDPPTPKAEIDAKAEQVRREMREQVDPEVLAALYAKIGEEFLAETRANQSSGKRVEREG